VALGQDSFLRINRDDIKSFTLFTPGGNVAFYRVPEISNNCYCQLIATGPACTVYKKITTRLKKPDYRTTGLTESGNKYYEYKDFAEYFIVNVSGKNKFSGKFFLNRRSIEKVFAFDRQKLDAYLHDHGKSAVNELFIKSLADYFNETPN
jgi:hypothetical protein